VGSYIFITSQLNYIGCIDKDICIDYYVILLLLILYEYLLNTWKIRNINNSFSKLRSILFPIYINIMMCIYYVCNVYIIV